MMMTMLIPASMRVHVSSLSANAALHIDSPQRDDAILWVRSSVRPIVSDLLDRSVSVLAAERNGQADNIESQEIVEAEKMVREHWNWATI